VSTEEKGKVFNVLRRVIDEEYDEKMRRVFAGLGSC